MNLNELIVLLKSSNSVDLIINRQEEIVELIPQCKVMIGYDQKHPNHQYDLWNHCLHTVIELPHDLEDGMIYLAALLHDIAKPDCRQEIKEGESLGKIYEGHPELSAILVKNQVIPTLIDKGEFLSAIEQERLFYYIAHHDDHLHFTLDDIRNEKKEVMNKTFCNLLYLEIADSKAHIKVPLMEERIDVCLKMIDELKC